MTSFSFEYINDNQLHWLLLLYVSHVLDLSLTGNVKIAKVVTSNFRKPVVGNTFFDARSCHPRHIIQAIPMGDHVRFKWAFCDLNFLMKNSDLNSR